MPSDPHVEEILREARAKANGPEIVDAHPPEFSDEGLALQFTKRHADEMRYVAIWNRWLLWEDTRWRFDDTLRAFDLSRAVCRSASAIAPDRKSAVASAKTVAAVVTLSRSDRRLAATVDQWDHDPWLLNTP